MGASDLLQMLATETDRRTPAIVKGVKRMTEPAEPDADAIEEIRVEAHGLKGAALVVGQKRLAELAREMEVVLTQRIAPGVIEPDVAESLVGAAEALDEGVNAAAGGAPEPKSVEESLAALKRV